MIHFRFSDKDSRYLFLKFDNNEDYQKLQELKAAINLTDPVCYLSTFQGEPFTQDFLYEYNQASGNTIFYCSIGLWQIIYKWLKNHDIPYDGLDPDRFKKTLPHSYDEFKSIVDSWNLSRSPREYQYKSAYNILSWNRSVSELATRAGKTLISYIVFRYSMEYLGVKKILMIVPSVDLVKQGFQDFKDYAEFFNTECLWSGGKIVQSSNLTIATYQTLINYLDKTNKKFNPDFFNGYDIVFVDETHRATAASIKTIISQPFMKDITYAFGMTGTLPKEWTIDNYTVHALLGAKIQCIEARELMDAGYISNIKIFQHQLSYTDREKTIDTWTRCAEYCASEYLYEEKTTRNGTKKQEKISRENPHFLIQHEKRFPEGLKIAKDTIFAQTDKTVIEKKLEYKKTLMNLIKSTGKSNLLHIETMMVHFFEERIDYLINILRFNCNNGNTLILAQHREYIKHVYDRLVEAFPDRKVLYVIGGSKDRKTVKEQLMKEKDAILVAGYQLMSTGITLPNLHHGVLFESYQKDSLITQSLGRGLGLVEGKSQYELHDITDCFMQKYATNKIELQGKKRQTVYRERKYPFDVIVQKI